MRNSKRQSRITLLLAAGILLLAITGCSGNKPITIGVSVELSGPRGNIGLAIRNGAELAVEEINAQGGIQNRPLELLVRDDLGIPETARQVDAELVEAGVTAIIGHVTSQQTLAVYDQINEAQVILISPTASSPLFTGQDDYFFRVMQSNEIFGKALAHYIYQQGTRKLIGVYDLSNLAFTESFWEATKEEFIALGGEVLPAFFFVSADAPNLQVLIKDVASFDPEAVVFVASGVDTALMTQYARLQGLDADMYASSWALTDELLQKGGTAIEGMVLVGLYNPQDTSERYMAFYDAYVSRYGIEPGLGASHAYEAVLVLAEGLKATNGSSDGLREAIVEIRDFQGLQSSITIDSYGDVNREIYLVKIEDRDFNIIDAITLEDID